MEESDQGHLKILSDSQELCSVFLVPFITEIREETSPPTFSDFLAFQKALFLFI